MDLLPILSTLRRHKTAASLIVVEVALTAAIVCNALHLIGQRLQTLNADSGVAEPELVVMEVRGTGDASQADALTTQDLQGLAALPGVKSVVTLNQVIYGDNSNNDSVTLKPGRDVTPNFVATRYEGGENTLATLGLKLIEGRDFKPEEYIHAYALSQQEKPAVGQVILNREMAEKLFPGRSAVGQVLYAYEDSPSTVVGVVERLTHPYPGRSFTKSELAMMFPVRPSYRGGVYLLRVDPAQRDSVMRAAPGVIERVDASRIVNKTRTTTEMRAAYYAQDRAMAWLMGGVCVAMLVVTAFGIVGLASFWVQQRTRMIGTRRALGATRGQILRYFQAENFLLTGAGIVLGLAGALGLNLMLMKQYELPRLPWELLPVGALVLWALGQVAVLAPARRASALPPVAALRS